MITIEQLKKLNDLALAATQKQWFVVGDGNEDRSAISTMTKAEYDLTVANNRVYDIEDETKPYVSIYDTEILGSSEWLRALPADLDFIAAANPLVVLALINEIKALEFSLFGNKE